jgi:predicted nucleotidyltransferase component of viral defense system
MISLDSIASEYSTNLKGFRKNIIREYLQYKILYHIFNSPFSHKLSFIGGTALRIAYDNQRFSEDLDFDNFGLTIEEFKELALFLCQKLSKEGYEVEHNVTKKGAFRTDIKFKNIYQFYGVAIMETEKLLIQVDTAPHNFLYMPKKQIINKFDVYTEILVTPPDILLSQKIRALLERPRTLGRDIFDIIFLSSKTKPNYDYLREKLVINNSEELKTKLREFIDTKDMATLKKDLMYMIFNEADLNKLSVFKENLEKLDF